ncbi:MAG: four helix bundle protein [Opitutae bacterium]|nr:four helix bundle protein [Opitutae bacterium]
MGRIDRFEDLDCWKASRELRVFVTREITPQLPVEERYRLVDQLIRAARSTTANIAEGFGRRHYLDNAKFIRNSLGSQHECLDHLITGNDEGMISDQQLADFRVIFEKSSALSNGYASYLARTAKK